MNRAQALVHFETARTMLSDPCRCAIELQAAWEGAQAEPDGWHRPDLASLPAEIVNFTIAHWIPAAIAVTPRLAENERDEWRANIHETVIELIAWCREYGDVPASLISLAAITSAASNQASEGRAS